MFGESVRAALPVARDNRFQPRASRRDVLGETPLRHHDAFGEQDAALERLFAGAFPHPVISRRERDEIELLREGPQHGLRRMRPGVYHRLPARLEDGQRLRSVVLRRPLERRQPLLVVAVIEVGAQRDELLHQRRVAVGRGLDQGSTPLEGARPQ